MRPVSRGARPSYVTARGTRQNKQYKEYGDLRIDLISRIGEYCSYCEVPLGVSLAIEHMLSKSWSINEIDWDNSLLACTNCNSHKTDKTTSELSLNSYFWPSKDSDGTFDMLLYVRENLSLQSLIDNGLLALSDARAKKLYVRNSYDMVWVKVNPTYVGQQREDKVKRTINLIGLNDYVPDDDNPKVSDRRVVNRTRAWERAELAATHLGKHFRLYNLQYNPFGNPDSNRRVTDQAAVDPKILMLKNQIKDLAAATGFWSVWVTVFMSRTFINDEVRKALICELFVRPFPGTRLPVAGITACP